ncbi:MAG: hypothetical protein QOJ56_6163 [Mycobacterium sp.]|jgi:hypothetical protein|nr:hypothetical protein [Mycobacterium sp.]
MGTRKPASRGGLAESPRSIKCGLLIRGVGPRSRRGYSTALQGQPPDFLLELEIDQEGTEQPKADAIRTLLEKWVERIER